MRVAFFHSRAQLNKSALDAGIFGGVPRECFYRGPVKVRLDSMLKACGNDELPQRPNGT